LAIRIFQIPPPNLQVGVQPFEIEFREGTIRASEIPQGTLQNRARAHMIASGLVMKSDCQLHHTLEMPTQRPVAGQRPPNVFENFMGVEKQTPVEKIEARI
jgi:hypothetical protein